MKKIESLLVIMALMITIFILPVKSETGIKKYETLDIPVTCVMTKTGVYLEDCGATVFQQPSPTTTAPDTTPPDDDALDAAIFVAVQARGGTINFPTGEILLTRGHIIGTPDNYKYSYTLQGFSGSVVRLRAGGHRVFTFRQAKIATVDRLTVYGTQVAYDSPQFIDAEQVFHFGADVGVLRSTMVAGVAVSQAIVDTAAADVNVKDYIGGGNSSIIAHFITSGERYSKSLRLENAKIFDYETINNSEFINKSSSRFQTWIYYDPQVLTQPNANSPRTLIIDGGRFDEAAFNAIVAKNMWSVSIRDVFINQSGAPNGASIVLDNVKSAIVEQSLIGYGGGNNNAIEARNNTKVTVTGLNLGNSVKWVADDETSTITLRQCWAEVSAYPAVPNQCGIRSTN